MLNTRRTSIIPRDVSRECCATCHERTSCPFVDLPQEIVKQLHAIGQMKLYSQGVTIFQQGEEAAGLFVIRSGWVKVFHLSPVGKAITLGLAGQGRLLSLIEVVTNGQCEVSAEALEQSKLEYIAKKELQQVLFESPLVAVRLLRAACREMQQSMTELYQTVGKVPLDKRLLHMLQDLSVTCGQLTAEGIRLKLPFTVQDLADRIGCSREWASGLLSNLQLQGLIRRVGRWITLTPQALKDRSLY